MSETTSEIPGAAARRFLSRHMRERLDTIASDYDELLAADESAAGRIEAVRAHIADRTHGDCDGDNPQWDAGFKAACSQILAVLDGRQP